MLAGRRAAGTLSLQQLLLFSQSPENSTYFRLGWLWTGKVVPEAPAASDAILRPGVCD